MSLEALELAWLGDSFYELYIKEYLLKNKKELLKEFQKESIKYLSAEGERNLLECLINNNILTDDEIDIYKRGRNKSPKRNNKDIITYRIGTGFETLVGYLYFNDKERLLNILEWGLENEGIWKK